MEKRSKELNEKGRTLAGNTAIAHVQQLLFIFVGSHIPTMR